MAIWWPNQKIKNKQVGMYLWKESSNADEKMKLLCFTFWIRSNFPYLVIQQVGVHECSRLTHINFNFKCERRAIKISAWKMVMGYMGLIYFYVLSIKYGLDKTKKSLHNDKHIYRGCSSTQINGPNYKMRLLTLFLPLTDGIFLSKSASCHSTSALKLLLQMQCLKKRIVAIAS